MFTISNTPPMVIFGKAETVLRIGTLLSEEVDETPEGENLITDSPGGEDAKIEADDSTKNQTNEMYY